MQDLVQFNNHNLEIINKNGQRYFSAPQIGAALGYSRSDQIIKIYNAHKDEFTNNMTETAETALSGNLITTTRIFSLRGCHLLAMFSRTPVAKEFRRWVLDLIERYNQPQLPAPLDAKAVGGIVKNCCAVAVREELEHAATDMVYAEKFKQLARSALYDYIGEVMLNEEMLPKWRAMFQRWMKDVIFSEDYFGALKKLIIPWVKDAAAETLGKSIDAYIKAEMDERVKYFVEYVFKNYPKMSQGMKEYLITYGIVNYGKFSEYSREKDFKGICETIWRQEQKDPEARFAM